MTAEETREEYEEINALVSMIAKAHGIDDKVAASEIEAGVIVVTLEEDELGERYISAVRDGKQACVYQGVIRYAPGVEPPAAAADETPAPQPEEHQGCGCSCGKEE